MSTYLLLPKINYRCCCVRVSHSFMVCEYHCARRKTFDIRKWRRHRPTVVYSVRFILRPRREFESNVTVGCCYYDAAAKMNSSNQIKFRIVENWRETNILEKKISNFENEIRAKLLLHTIFGWTSGTQFHSALLSYTKITIKKFSIFKRQNKFVNRVSPLNFPRSSFSFLFFCINNYWFHIGQQTKQHNKRITIYASTEAVIDIAMDVWTAIVDDATGESTEVHLNKCITNLKWLKWLEWFTV